MRRAAEGRHCPEAVSPPKGLPKRERSPKQPDPAARAKPDAAGARPENQKFEFFNAGESWEGCMNRRLVCIFVPASLIRPAPFEPPQDRKVARIEGCSGAI